MKFFSLYQNVLGSETLHLEMQILKSQLFLIQSMSSMWREWEGVKKKVTVSIPLQTPSTTENTLTYRIDPNQEASPQSLRAQQHRKAPLCSSYLAVSYLPAFYFSLCQLQCCYDYGAFDVIPGFFEAKLALHAQCCNLQYWGPRKWLKNKQLFLFRSSKCKLVSANNWASCWFK